MNLNLLYYIKISFDGFTARPNLRGINTLDKILSLVRLLEKYDIPFAINTVLTKNILHDLNEFYDYIAFSKTFSWRVYPLIFRGRAPNIIKSANISESTKTISPFKNDLLKMTAHFISKLKTRKSVCSVLHFIYFLSFIY